MQQPPFHQPPHVGNAAPPPYPPAPYPGYYRYPAPPQSSGIHPLIWIGLALALFSVFAGAAAFALVVARSAAMASAAPPPTPTFVPHSSTSHGSTGSDLDEDDDDLDDPAIQTPALPAPHRDIPIHEVKMLDGCSTADLKLVENQIEDAIETGAPTYNRGDFLGCYSTYDQTAKTIESKLPKACKGPAKALEEGRTKAKSKVSPADRAWAMRDTFDGLLDVIDRKGQEL